MTGEVLLTLRLLLGASLFAFLGWVLWFLWNDLRIQAGLLAARKVPPLSLLVQVVDDSPHLFNFNQAEITIGRDPACECLLNDDAVSTHHARFNYHHLQWWIEDLGSKNGTKLNQEILSLPAVVISGDKIECGHTMLTVVINPNQIISPG
jgi:pSer/pThr/pTyr-binding forkhead associated (FHA) protein